MRIISGRFKGRRITAPKKLPARPTTDFAKEALFNILNNHYHFSQIRVLDLFAGIGSISFEFASRGCHDLTAVEQHFLSAKFIQKIANELEFPMQIITTDVFHYLPKCRKTFDVIFADPPYDFDVEKITQLTTPVFSQHLLNKDGYLIIEHSKHMDLSQLEHFCYTKKYGNSVFSFFQEES
ncbi:RsmD family RNA methyltransferase [Flavobacteriaceae bacterium F08102]|nr:RsmD family RNA methyltransferase [Flavobacteriaceae bacterium F08102]